MRRRCPIKQDIATWRANTKAELQDLLRSGFCISPSSFSTQPEFRSVYHQDDRRILEAILFFKEFEGVDNDSNTRDNMYVFIDEAHRSVAKDLGTYLMASVPNRQEGKGLAGALGVRRGGNRGPSAGRPAEGIGVIDDLVSRYAATLAAPSADRRSLLGCSAGL